MNKFQILNNGLQINKISKSFGNKQVVRDISIGINRGEVVGLLGPNGAGKTTTFHIVVGLLKPDSGSIFLDKVNISTLPIYLRGQKGISYLPQEPSIFRGMNVEDNLMAIIEITENDKTKHQIIMENLLNEFDIHHVRKSKSIVLSGGERRRLELARTLASKPKYLLLDEPLTGIDPVSIEGIKSKSSVSPTLEAIQNDSAKLKYSGETQWALVGDTVGEWVVTHLDASKVRIKHSGNSNSKTLVLNW